MVQAFYIGGATIFDWTDPAKPIEIGFYDRGPGGGYWSTYWFNGAIYSSDESRGFDVHELTPSQCLSKNEIDAARSVKWDEFNAQGQPHNKWPPTFALARAYLDQLERNSGLAKDRITAIRSGLTSAERGGCGARNGALAAIGAAVNANDVAGAADKGRVQLMANAIVDLAKTACVDLPIP
jgi:hypothetical protein